MSALTDRLRAQYTTAPPPEVQRARADIARRKVQERRAAFAPWPHETKEEDSSADTGGEGADG